MERVSYEDEPQIKLGDEEVPKAIDLSSLIVLSYTHPRDPLFPNIDFEICSPKADTDVIFSCLSFDMECC